MISPTSASRARWLTTILLAVLLTPGIALAGPFGPSSYVQSADSPFAGLPFDYFHLETFEDGLLNTPGVASAGSVSPVPGPSAPNNDSVDADDGTIDGSGSAGRSWVSPGLGNGGIRFDFSAVTLGTLPTHAGLVWTDGFTSTYTVVFEAFGPGGASLGTIVASNFNDNNFSGGTAEDRFFGWADPGGISAISIRSTVPSPDPNAIEVDHLQYGAVPEPSSLLLLATGLAAGAGAWRRRHRRVGGGGLRRPGAAGRG